MPISVFTVSLTSGQSLPDSGLDLSEDGWERIHVEVPSMASGSFQFYVASTSDGTYRPILKDDESAIFSVNSSLVANGCVAEVPGGYRFVKPRNTSGATDTTTVFNVICTRN